MGRFVHRRVHGSFKGMDCMSALDRFIEDAAARLELGYRARSVVNVLAGWIASHPLGLDGLAQQFEQAGLGAQFRSWQRPAEPSRPVLASELERAIGPHALVTMARRTGFPPGTFRVIACELLPGLVALASAARPVRVAPFQSAGLRRPRGIPVASARTVHGLALRGMVWVLAGVALIGFTTWLHLNIRGPHWVAPVITEQRDARLSLHQYGDRIVVQGRLPSEAARRQAWNALIALHGRDNVRGGIALDPATRPPRWLDRLTARIAQMEGDGLLLDFNGDALRVDTSAMEAEQRLEVSRLLRRHFADLQTTGLWGPGLAALAALPVQAEATKVVEALNQTTLKFRPGSAVLTGDSADTVDAVAAALTLLPDTRIDVEAHTDSNGGADANLLLSQQRAATVVQALRERGVPTSRLVATGHGQQYPIADNRDEAGRARNRRITYTVRAPERDAGTDDVVAWQDR